MRRPDLTCLVMMPFDPAFDDVYAVIRTAVVEGAGDVGAACQRLDEMKRPGRISEELVEALEVTDFCVADLTGGNPNVMWEVGYAMALEKPIVFISQGVEALPFDLKDMRTVSYHRRDLAGTLRSQLGEAVAAVVGPDPRVFRSWKREQVVYARGRATALRVLTDEGALLETTGSAWTQDLEDVVLRLRAVDARLSALYTLRHGGDVRMRGSLVGSGALVSGRAYLSYRVEDRERGQGIHGVLKLIVPQWGPIAGYYLAQSYAPGAGTVLGKVSLERVRGRPVHT